MKVIPVVGYSGAGKTTFILRLIRRLKEMGPVGVIKHLGHHPFRLEEGKDTSLFYESGADMVAGVDGEKTVFITPEKEIEKVLVLLSDRGMRFAVVEGLKTIRFPKVTIGELEAEQCVLKNPEPEDVVRSLDKFEDFYTMNGLVTELKRECDVKRAGVIVTINGIVREWTGEVRTDYMDFENDIERKIQRIKEKMEKIDGILGVKFHHRKGRLFAGDDITYIAILASHRKEAFLAASRALDELKDQLHAHLPGSVG